MPKDISQKIHKVLDGIENFPLTRFFKVLEPYFLIIALIGFIITIYQFQQAQELAEEEREQRKMDRELAAEEREQRKIDRELAEEEREQRKLDRELAAEQREINAWQILVSKAPGNTGKKEALEHLHKLEKPLHGIDLSGTLNSKGKYTDGVYLRKLEMPNAKLNYAKLMGADLLNANLQDADLYEANLQDANLNKANLQDAKLWYANLQDAYLFSANLQDAKLRDANLQDAYLYKANLQDADLFSANLQDAVMVNTKFERIVGLNKVKSWLGTLVDDRILKALSIFERFRNLNNVKSWQGTWVDDRILKALSITKETALKRGMRYSEDIGSFLWEKDSDTGKWIPYKWEDGKSIYYKWDGSQKKIVQIGRASCRERVYAPV